MQNINTLFIPRDPSEEFLLISKIARIQHTVLSFKFFFFVTPATTIAELATLWSQTEYPMNGVLAPAFSSFHAPVSPACWTFRGRRMIWSDTIRGLGMAEEDNFEILLAGNQQWEEKFPN